MAGPSYGSGAPDTVPEVDSPGQGFEPIPASTFPGYLSPWVALVEVLLVCGIPTQVLIFVPIALFTGVPILQGRQVSIELFAVTSLLDTALIAILIRLFLGLSGETSADDRARCPDSRTVAPHGEREPARGLYAHAA
jgi:hypothetical protein